MTSYYIYVVSNPARTVLYTGVTNDLIRRIYEHKTKFRPKSFASKYNCTCLVYYELFNCIGAAIDREKEIKGWKRMKKDELIKGLNPRWLDLYLEF